MYFEIIWDTLDFEKRPYLWTILITVYKNMFLARNNQLRWTGGRIFISHDIGVRAYSEIHLSMFGIGCLQSDFETWYIRILLPSTISIKFFFHVCTNTISHNQWDKYVDCPCICCDGSIHILSLSVWYRCFGFLPLCMIWVFVMEKILSRFLSLLIWFGVNILSVNEKLP